RCWTGCSAANLVLGTAVFCHQSSRYIESGRFDKFCGRTLIGKQGFDFVTQLLIVLAFVFQKSAALVGCNLQRGMIQVFNALPPFRFHDALLRGDLAAATLSQVSSRASQYRPTLS